MFKSKSKNSKSLTSKIQRLSIEIIKKTQKNTSYKNLNNHLPKKNDLQKKSSKKLLNIGQSYKSGFQKIWDQQISNITQSIQRLKRLKLAIDVNAIDILIDQLLSIKNNSKTKIQVPKKNKEQTVINKKQQQKKHIQNKNAHQSTGNDEVLKDSMISYDKPAFMEKCFIQFDFSDKKNEQELLREKVQYSEISLLSEATIYLSDFKKFSPASDILIKENNLLVPQTKMRLFFILAYLQFLINSQTDIRLLKFKKNILQCPFDKYLPGNKNIYELIQTEFSFKCICIKIINEAIKQKSVYKIVYQLDVDEILQFLLECLILNFKKILKYAPINKQNLLDDFTNCFEITYQQMFVLTDPDTKAPINVLKWENQYFSVQI